MRLAVDENLPDILCDWLAERGHDVVHVREWLRAGTADARIWTHALEDGRVIVTKDHDFRIRRSREAGPSILFLHVGNVSNATLLALMERVWSTVVARFDEQAPVVLVTLDASVEVAPGP